MNRSGFFQAPLIYLAALLLMAGSPALAQDEHAHHHQHGGGVPDMDADGKRLESYQVKHDMDEEP